MGKPLRRLDPGTAVAGRLRAAVRALAARAGGQAAALDVRAAGEVLAPLARRCGTDLDRFLTEIALGAETDALDPRADAVTLLTLHAAKGLEFEVVFLAGCEKGLLPLWIPGQGPASEEELAEERRLLFVGISRARARLFLTCACRRTRHGSTRDTGPSPLVGAIDAALLDRASTPARPARPASRQLRLLERRSAGPLLGAGPAPSLGRGGRWPGRHWSAAEATWRNPGGIVTSVLATLAAVGGSHWTSVMPEETDLGHRPPNVSFEPNIRTGRYVVGST